MELNKLSWNHYYYYVAVSRTLDLNSTEAWSEVVYEPALVLEIVSLLGQSIILST